MSFNGTIEVSCSDSDFYQRKIIRLQDDISILHDQLTKVKAKLRLAQDFQIRYHILLKTSQTQIQQIKQSEQSNREQAITIRVQQRVSEHNEQWQNKLKALEQSLRKEKENDINSMSDENNELKRKINELNTKIQSSQILNLKIRKLEKEKENVEEQMTELREHFQKKKEEEIGSLRTYFNSNFRQKLTNQRKAYELRISALEKKLIDKDIEKDQQLFKLPGSSNTELAALKQLVEEQASRHSKELEDLNIQVQKQNEEIKRMLEEKSKLDEKHHQEILLKERAIVELQSVILERDEEHQKELLSVINKSSEMRNQQISELTSQIQELKEENTSQKKWWSSKLTNHDQQIANLSLKYEAEIQRLTDNTNDLKVKITELLNRLKEYEGDKAEGEEEELLASFKDLQQKKAHISNYDDGITFFEGQLARCQRRLEQKTCAVLAVNKEIAQIRAEYAQQSAETYEKLAALKLEHNCKVTSLEKIIEELNEQLRKREKEIKRMQRQQTVLVNEYQLSDKKLKYALQEVQRDYKRAVQSKKEANSVHMAEKKEADSKEEGGNTKKIKWLQVQRQKNNLQTIYRQRQEQLKLKYEGDLTQKQRELTRMKRQVQLGEKEQELLANQNKKLKEELDYDKQNCSVRRYQNKLASLNLQLALAQNVYDCMVKAKFKAGEQYGSPKQSVYREDAPFQTESQDPMMMSFDPSIHGRT